MECLPFDLPVAPSRSELGPQADAGTQSPQTCPRAAVEPGQPQAGRGQHSPVPRRVLGHQAMLRKEQPPQTTCRRTARALSPLPRRHFLLPWAVYEAPLSGKRTPTLSTACTHGCSTPCKDSGSGTLRQTLPVQPRMLPQAGHRGSLGLSTRLHASLAHPARPSGCWVISPTVAAGRLGCWAADEARQVCRRPVEFCH